MTAAQSEKLRKRTSVIERVCTEIEDIRFGFNLFRAASLNLDHVRLMSSLDGLQAREFDMGLHTTATTMSSCGRTQLR